MHNLTLNRRPAQTLASGLMLMLITLYCHSHVYSQSTGSFWADVSENSIAAQGIRHTVPQKYRTMSLNVSDMRQLFSQAPQEKNTSLRSSGAIITLPLPDGKLARFRFVESPVMAPSLAAQFPEIRTFTGVGIDDHNLACTFDFTPAGFHGMIHSTENGLSFIDPYSLGQNENYIIYAKKDYIAKPNKAFFEPDVLGTETENARKIAELVKQRRAQRMQAQTAAPRPSGDQLRTYRVAIAATGEYTAFQGGTVSAALAAINTTLNRVNF